jgi:putative methyltransferase (TIGR04325 family)
MNSIKEKAKKTVKSVTPPIIYHLAKRIYDQRPGRFIEWQYMPEGWHKIQTDFSIKGWNVESVLEAYKSKWPDFIKGLEGSHPFGLSPESIHPEAVNLTIHNLMMSYAYCLALASRSKASISMLDWGGGIGHYYFISKALFPELEIDYSCKDVPILAEYGQAVIPNGHFYVDESLIERSFDFVLASGSIHYSEDWKSVLSVLRRLTGGYLLVTRLPIVHRAPSYVFIQRPYAYGYNTEYLGWCLNRDEFLNTSRQIGLSLCREFVTGEAPLIDQAPEACEYRGFLFQPDGERKPAD